ncbi:MAG: hypothetical protein QM638_21035 [Nocardioides sp.]|uniref:hypothetical protein n=1 Tax=Nocardioides sp. TaxID=35761 RepID=UPI0039E47729
MRRLAGRQELVDRLDRQLARIEEHERELARIGPQLAALEERVESLRERVEGVPVVAPRPDGSADALDQVEARSLWDELQRQREQVRARISAAARFEERLRQIEESLGS